MGRFLLMETALYKFIMKTDFNKKLNSGTLMILDGAYGTMLMKYCQSGIVDQLNLDAPELVSDLHQAYIDAGAEIIKTNTFNCCDPTVLDFRSQKELTKAGVLIARNVADELSTPQKSIFVAGSIGPTAIRLSEADRNGLARFATLRSKLMEACRTAATIMIEGGCEFLLIETSYDLASLCATLEAVESAQQVSLVEIPIAVSLTVDPTTMTIASGESLGEVVQRIDRFNIAMLGINCVDYRHIARVAIALRAMTDKPLILSPNIGCHESHGHNDVSPTEFAACMTDALRSVSPSITGGCCGTTPAHIRAMKELGSDIRP